MPTKLYLDTARLGQMSKTAQLALFDFIRFAGEEGGSLYFDRLLRHGSQALPRPLIDHYPALNSWHGLESLAGDLRSAAGARSDSRVIVANRSSQLMRFAARLLFGPCTNILITDLTWPSYERILREQLGHADRHITKVSLRDEILSGSLDVADVVKRSVSAFSRHRCDGLCLPAVDNLGIRFPVREVVDAISRVAKLRFVVIDGAQELCHLPFSLADDYCDFYIAGCHKWMRAHNPLGLGFYGRPRSRDYVETRLSQAIHSGGIDDPLLTFSEEIVRGSQSQFGETVNLSPLFSCQGALRDFSETSRHEIRMENAARIRQVARETSWSAPLPREPFRSAIVILDSGRGGHSSPTSSVLRAAFLRRGVALTAYDDGRLRLSAPSRPLDERNLARLKQALMATSVQRKSPEDDSCVDRLPGGTTA